METLRAVWAIVVALWNTGNRWARWTIGTISFWPVILVGVAITGIPILIALLALLPVLAVILLLLAIIDPLVLAVIGSFEKGRKVLRIFATIIGTELVIGVYFSTIPVWKDRELIPLLVLVLAAIGFLTAGLQGKIAKRTISILVLFAIVLTAIFIGGGREKLYQKWESMTASSVAAEKPATAVTQPAPPQQWQLCWEKTPEHRGKTAIRQNCNTAVIERQDEILVVKYVFSGGQGTIFSTKTPDGAYLGVWRDSTGSGNIFLRFTSNCSAFGWQDDGKGTEKDPTSLVAK